MQICGTLSLNQVLALTCFAISEIVRSCGETVCAALSPYGDTCNDVRIMIGGDHYIEAWIQLRSVDSTHKCNFAVESRKCDL